eukprot:1665861-Amphidinium_carterae.1
MVPAGVSCDEEAACDVGKEVGRPEGSEAQQRYSQECYQGRWHGCANQVRWMMVLLLQVVKQVVDSFLLGLPGRSCLLLPMQWRPCSRSN